MSAPEIPVEMGNDFVVARGSAIHGHGLYARRALAAGEVLAEYVGERISKAEADRRCREGNPFIVALDEATDLDGNMPDNLARFANHSCQPNCELVHDEDCDRLELTTVRGIEPGEEITFDYGYDLAGHLEHPCRCGAVACAGFIVAAEFRGQLRQMREAAAG